jgi:hypothetical protein
MQIVHNLHFPACYALGMQTKYKGKDIALKVLASALTKDEEQVRMFGEEAANLATCAHE